MFSFRSGEASFPTLKRQVILVILRVFSRRFSPRAKNQVLYLRITYAHDFYMQYPDPIAPKRLTVAELREKVGAIARLEPLPGWSVPQHELTIPRGALVELLGAGSREWLFRMFRAHAETRIAWVEPKLSLYPPAVAQRGVSLSRMLFVETKRDWNWALFQILRSKLFHFAVTPVELVPAKGTDVFLRKLQIQAERAGTTLFFLSDTDTPFFGITHRIRVGEQGGRPEILKRKRG
jgi:hypothetical protein